MSTSKSLIVIFSGSPYAGVRRSARGLSESLADHLCVLFVDPTASPFRASQSVVLRPALSHPAPNLFHLAAVTVPGHTRFGIRRIVRSVLSRAVRAAISEIDVGSPAAVFLQTPQVNLLGSFDEDISVYWATDSFADGFALMGNDRASVARAEMESATNADLVIAVTESLASRWIERGKRVAVVRNGVDIDAIPISGLPIPDDLTLERPIAAVVGTLSSRLDFDLLAAVSDAGVSVLLLGPASFRTGRSAFDALRARSNVLWLGEKGHADLGSYYEHVDVGLVPYTLSEFNRVSAPLKPLEYLAMGLPVVSTRLPGVVAIDSLDIAFADDAAGFASATKRAIDVSDNTGLIDRRRRHASEWSWDRRAIEVLRLLGLDSS